MSAKWRRRAVTIPLVSVAFVAVSGLCPLLLVAALLVDLTRWLIRRRSFTTLRLVAFLWIYLLGQVVGLTALFWVWARSLPAGGARAERLLSATFSVQQRWAHGLFRAVSVLFGLDLEVEGDEQLEPGPYIVFIRHASLIDTLLPSLLVTERHGIRLRFVLKRELLADPCLDVAGLRLPNHFVQRTGEDKSDVDGVSKLAAGLGPMDGVLLYPEGTRFSSEKQRRALDKLGAEAPELFALARPLTHVLPPRLGGALAALDAAPNADAIFFAHTGLDGFATVSDIFARSLGRRKIRVKIRRVPRNQIPEARADRVRWLFDEWQNVNDWIAKRSSRDGEVSALVPPDCPAPPSP